MREITLKYIRVTKDAEKHPEEADASALFPLLVTKLRKKSEGFLVQFDKAGHVQRFWRPNEFFETYETEKIVLEMEDDLD